MTTRDEESREHQRTREERDLCGTRLFELTFDAPARLGLMHGDAHPGNFMLRDDGIETRESLADATPDAASATPDAAADAMLTTDTVRKTGAELFCSLLLWRALGQLADLAALADAAAQAERYEKLRKQMDESYKSLSDDVGRTKSDADAYRDGFEIIREMLGIVVDTNGDGRAVGVKRFHSLRCLKPRRGLRFRLRGILEIDDDGVRPARVRLLPALRRRRRNEQHGTPVQHHAAPILPLMAT